jgi:hypothetical protein
MRAEKKARKLRLKEQKRQQRAQEKARRREFETRQGLRERECEGRVLDSNVKEGLSCDEDIAGGTENQIEKQSL